MVAALGLAALRSDTGKRLTAKVRKKAEAKAAELIEKGATAAVRKARAKLTGKKGGRRW